MTHQEHSGGFVSQYTDLRSPVDYQSLTALLDPVLQLGVDFTIRSSSSEDEG